MSTFEFDAVDRFTTGTVGEPGARVFFLQVVFGTEVTSFRLEKQQVQALVDYLAGLLSDLPQAPEADVPTEMDLIEPTIEEWVVGSIGIAYDEDAQRFALLLEEVGADDEGFGEDAGRARIGLSIGQATALVPHAASLLDAGRPPCPLCNRPLNPDGHRCARLNGHGVH